MRVFHVGNLRDGEPHVRVEIGPRGRVNGDARWRALLLQVRAGADGDSTVTALKSLCARRGEHCKEVSGESADV